jgi:hypothetical protein
MFVAACFHRQIFTHVPYQNGNFERLLEEMFAKVEGRQLSAKDMDAVERQATLFGDGERALSPRGQTRNPRPVNNVFAKDESY